jgi:hypothetical protein
VSPSHPPLSGMHNFPVPLKTGVSNVSFQEARKQSSTMIIFSWHACLPLTSRSFRETRATKISICRVTISPTTFRHVQFSCLIKHWHLKCEPPAGSHSHVLMLNNNKDSCFDINTTTTICRKWVPPLSLLCAPPTNHVCPIVNAAPPVPHGVWLGVMAGIREKLQASRKLTFERINLVLTFLFGFDSHIRTGSYCRFTLFS